MASIYLPVGSEHGTALAVANSLKSELASQGFDCLVSQKPSVAELKSRSWVAILICTSSTGDGELPTNIFPFYCELEKKLPLLTGQKFGLVALGDSSYQNYCGAGDLIEERFLKLQAQAPVPRLNIDATETVQPDEDAKVWLLEWLAGL